MEYIHARMIETTKTCLQLALRVVNLEDHRIKSTSSKPHTPKNLKKQPDKSSLKFILHLHQYLYYFYAFEQPLNLFNHHFPR